MSTVIVVGSTNVDVTVEAERLPTAGETVLGSRSFSTLGGKGANQAIAAKRAGAAVVFLTKVGRDATGERARTELTQEGLPPDGLLDDAATSTGLAVIVVDREGRNQIAVAPGANERLMPDDVERVVHRMQPGGVLLCQLEVPLPTVLAACTLAKAQGLRTILNPAPARALSDELLARVDLLTPNETEASFLTNESDPLAAGQRLVERGIPTVIVTLGAQGALLVRREGHRLFPPMPVTAVDSTGAGDAFNGALAAMLAEGASLDRAIAFANVAGALATTVRGAVPSLPTRAAIDRLYGAHSSG